MHIASAWLSVERNDAVKRKKLYPKEFIVYVLHI